MRRARLVVLAAGLALTALAGCGGDDDSSAVEEVLVPGPLAPSDISVAGAEACGIEQRTVQAAVDAYTGLEGAPPADAQALVDQQYLDTLPTLYVVEDGVVKPAPGGPCT